MTQLTNDFITEKIDGSIYVRTSKRNLGRIIPYRDKWLAIREVEGSALMNGNAFSTKNFQEAFDYLTNDTGDSNASNN